MGKRDSPEGKDTIDYDDLTKLGLSDTDYSQLQEWEVLGFKSTTEYEDYLFFQSWENDEEYDNMKSELLGN